MRPFVILGMPRSRTAWLARFLSHGNRVCLHEPSRNWTSVDDLRAALDVGAGLSDSTLTLRWRDIANHAPGAAVVVVHRAEQDVLSSFRRAGLWHARLPAALGILNGAIDELTEGLPGALHVPFEVLRQHDVCARVFTHCLDVPMPFTHWCKWRDQRVLADATRHVSEAAANGKWSALFPELVGAA